MAQISLYVDDDVKSNAEKALDEIGLSMSAAINIFLKKVARERRIPFELSADWTQADNLNADASTAINEIKRNAEKYTVYNSFSDLLCAVECRCADGNGPFYVTKSGCAPLVLMDIEYFERMARELSEAQALAAAMKDLETGRTVDGDSAIANVRNKI